MLLTLSAIISLAIGIYEDLTIIEYDTQGNRIPGVKWVEGVAIIIAVSLVVIVGSVNDYKKENQFRSLNAKKEDREVTVRRLKSIMTTLTYPRLSDVENVYYYLSMMYKWVMYFN
jgi:Ca2+-transporting ATPase